jgi:hypothetical protein
LVLVGAFWFYTLAGTAIPRGVGMAGISQNPFCATYFFSTAK